MNNIPVLYEDDSLFIIHKPAGLLSEDVPGGVIPALREQTGHTALYCVHRLDREVGGLLVVAKSKKAVAPLTEAFTAGAVQKRYLAVLTGVPEEAEATLSDYIYHDPKKNRSYVVKSLRKGVKEASLAYRALSGGMIGEQKVTLAEVFPKTGRSHQIRLQFASRKLPLAGDARYGSTIRSCPIGLFCAGLSFRHPLTGKPLSFSVLPEQALPWAAFPSIDNKE